MNTLEKLKHIWREIVAPVVAIAAMWFIVYFVLTHLYDMVQ
jgi:hypothetical protein